MKPKLSREQLDREFARYEKGPPPEAGDIEDYRDESLEDRDLEEYIGEN